MKKILLPTFWVLAIVGVFTLSSSFTDKSLHFFGIAGEPEQAINFQYPVEVVQFLVAEGTEVKQGEEILGVKRHDLDTDLIRLSQEIRKFQLQKQESNNSINSQLANLKANKQVLIADMDYQIHALKLRLQINNDMLNSISGSQGRKNRASSSPEIKDLKKKRHYSVQAIQVQIDHLNEQLNATNRPIDAQINELYTRKEELQRQNVSLTVKAKFDGRIGSINFKAGELVPPFQSIMSVHSRIPRYIKGYIHENVINDVKVGQTVWVNSIAFNDGKNTLKGVVESLGNRIVEYPERLKKNPLVPAWGREVVVRLNHLDNSLLFGEKVQVLLEQPDANVQVASMINTANASIHEIQEHRIEQVIKSSNAKIKAAEIEASGILWDARSGHYLLLSDESKKGQSALFIMNEEGVVSSRLSIPGMAKSGIDDTESISAEGDHIYLLSSLSHNKKNHLKAKRKKLLRFNYQQPQITQVQEVDLYEVLVAIKNASSTPAKLAHFLNQAIAQHSMDIESHFVKDNALYLGFKSPLINSSQSLIIKINDIAAMFAGKTPEADIWQTITLADPETGIPMMLSDMIMVEEQLFLLSVSHSAMTKSVLWHYQPTEKNLERIRQFPGLKAEGLSYRQEQSMFTLVFDEGKKAHSTYLMFPYSNPPRS